MNQILSNPELVQRSLTLKELQISTINLMIIRSRLFKAQAGFKKLRKYSLRSQLSLLEILLIKVMVPFVNSDHSTPEAKIKD